MNCGVPQRLCLGPLLFLIYINDLPCALQNTKVTIYANDTSISYSSKSVAEINEAINSDLKRLQIWLGGNKLSLNVAKTQSMILGSSSNLKKHHMDNGDTKINLHINEDNLKSVTKLLSHPQIFSFLPLQQYRRIKSCIFHLT